METTPVTPPQENDPVDSASFVAWAKDHAIPVSIPPSDDSFDDLDFLCGIIGEQRVVAFGETAHYMHEWNRFRARLFKYLVQTRGFNTFVLESGLVEGRNIHNYVAGSDVDWDTVITSVTNAWGVWDELQELIQWMRRYNENPDKDQELRFYCMDGTGNWFHARHAHDAVMTFARKVDTDLTSTVQGLEGAVQYINFDRRGEWEESTWKRLIADASLIVNRIEQHRLAYIEASSQDDFDWGLRSAEILRDVLLNLAQTELDFSAGFKTFWNVRDVSMARSLEWILNREGPKAKAVVGAHNTHLQQCPVRVNKATSMGSYVANRIGREKLLLIGTASTYSVKGEEPDPESCAAVYEKVGPDCFFLDLRNAPASGPVADWLGMERMDRHNLRYGPVTPGPAWDCLLFSRRVRIADVALAPSMEMERATPNPAQFDALSGRYLVLGFVAAQNTLDIIRDGDRLYTSGEDDTSGELFPPYRSEIFEAEDGRFVWNDWPARLAFHRDGDGPATRVTITMPGMGAYHGERVSGVLSQRMSESIT